MELEYLRKTESAAAAAAVVVRLDLSKSAAIERRWKTSLS